MIISSLLNAICTLFENIFNFTIAPIESIADITAYISLILDNGQGLYKAIFPPTSRIIITIILAVHGFIYGYYIIMWILKKVPMINIH